MLDIAPSPVTPLAADTVTAWGEPLKVAEVWLKVTCAAVGGGGAAKFAVAVTAFSGMENVVLWLFAFANVPLGLAVQFEKTCPTEGVPALMVMA